MGFKRSQVYREKLNRLKFEIKDFCINFNKRYQLFPWSQVSKLPKNRKYASMCITVSGNKYSLTEVVKIINKLKVDLRAKTKPSYYNNILRAYIKETNHGSDSSINQIYKVFSNELKTLFDSAESDLIFCADSLKEVNKIMKEQKRTISSVPIAERAMEDRLEIRSLVTEGYTLESGNYVSANDVLMEAYFDLDNEEIIENIMTEAMGNNDVMNFKDAKKEYKKICDEISSALRKKDYSNAKEGCKALIKSVDSIDKELTSSKNGISSVIIASFSLYIKLIAERLYVTFGCESSTMHKIMNKRVYEILPTAVKTSVGTILANVMEQTSTIYKEVKKHKEIDAKEFTSYWLKLKTCIKNIKNAILKISDGITEKETEDKRAQKDAKKALKAVAEATEFEHDRLELYEACQQGLITLEEREELLKDLQDRLYVQESIDDTDSSYDNNKIKYQKIKEDVYEKCDQGLMTVEMREDILDKAWNLLMVTEAEKSGIDIKSAMKQNKEIEKESQKSEKEIDTIVSNNQKELDKSVPTD